MKKCPYCAEEIRDEAIVCRFCGRDLPLSTSAAASPSSSTSLRVPRKKRWLAVALNLFPLVLGLGYLYLGLWKRFAVVFLIQILSLQAFNLCSMTAGINLREFNTYFLALIWIFTIFDVNAQAKAYNARLPI